MSATKGLFRKYANPVFVETGCESGGGIYQALCEGFDVIYSIELDEHWYKHSKDRFKDNPEVRVLLGDSPVILEMLLKFIEVPITFWLDAHDGSEKTPLLKELEIIKQHPIKTHTILIDDLRDWKFKRHGFNTDILRERLLEINPNYTIKFENGYVPNDILVATI